MTSGAGASDPGRPLAELPESGLLWLINAALFHPRGYALALHAHDDEITGWSLLGDGSEPWRFGSDSTVKFAAAEATMRQAREASAAGRPPEPG